MKGYKGVVFTLAIVIAAGLIGCGGSGGGAAGTTGNTTGGTTGTTTGSVVPLVGPGQVSGPAVSSATKYTDMDKVVAKYNTLLTNKVAPATRDQTLLKTLQGMSDFKQTGLSKDGTVWGRFQDNSYYMFNDHDVPDSFTPAQVRLTATSMTPQPSRRPQGAGGGTPMVDGSNALLLDVFDSSMGTPNSQIASMLSKRKFNVNATTADLGTLRYLSDVSILYWSSHGGQASNVLHPGTNFWSVWTNTQADEQSDALYKSDLDAGRLVYFDAPAGAYATGPLKDIQHRYAITAAWVTYYNWSFTTNSVAFINCCWSDAGGFTAALRALPKPAGLTYGWTNAANPTAAWKAASYFFDRSVGTNMYAPKMPGGIRPFSCDTVYGKMLALGLDDASTTAYGPSNLNEDGQDTMLAPSIGQMTIYDMPYEGRSPSSQLIINGQFGNSSPQSVTVGGTSVPFKYVSSTEIDAEPSADASTAGYSGAVQVVTTKGVMGNAPFLTSWSGTFEYDANPVPIYIKGKVTMTGSFRADIHKYRTEVDGDLTNPTSTYDRISQGTMMKWAAIGMLPDQVDSTPQSGSYSFGLVQGGLFGSGYELDATINRSSATFGLAFLYLGTDWTYTIGVSKPITNVIPPDNSLNETQGNFTKDKYGLAVYPPKLLGAMNDTYGTGKTIFQGFGYKANGAQFIFPALTPNFPPTTDTEEDSS